MVSEISQSQKFAYYMIPFIYNSRTGKSIETKCSFLGLNDCLELEVMRERELRGKEHRASFFEVMQCVKLTIACTSDYMKNT